MLTHKLEFADHPLVLLQQVYEALVPNGIFVLLGFNSLGLWNLFRLKRRQGFPWSGKFYMVWQVKQWMHEAGFKILNSKTFCFRPPLKNIQLSKNLLFLEPIGQFCFAALGSVYMITAQKYVPPVIPVKEHWWATELSVENGYVKPTTRTSCR